MIPTVLFGIPGASFAAVLIALFMYLGFELGTVDLAYDLRFFDSLTYGFMWGTVLVAFICISLNKYLCRISYVPYKYYFPLLVGFIVWACTQYTGGWEDYAILLICSFLGVFGKAYKYSRPAMLMAFILSYKVETLTLQLSSLYTWETLMTRPIFLGLIICIVLLFCLSLKKNKLEYS
jgi:TctA family transporter